MGIIVSIDILSNLIFLVLVQFFFYSIIFSIIWYHLIILLMILEILILMIFLLTNLFLFLRKLSIIFVFLFITLSVAEAINKNTKIIDNFLKNKNKLVNKKIININISKIININISKIIKKIIK